MAKYQQYAQYKDSGVEWLGEIPNSWGVTHLKFVASIVGRIGFRGYTVDDIVDEGQGAIVLSPSNVDNNQFSLEKKSYLSWAKYFESPEIMVEENDILLVKTGSTFGKSTIVREVGEPMTINPQMVLIKKSSIDSRFLSYLFNSSLIKAKIEVSNTGSGMPTMTQENINNFPIPLPATKIDIKIANFLDHETAQIDTLIEKQQTLIQLLKEKRQAVISHAVTKGLNPDALMKDSGVEWLGDVPEHWVVGRVGYYGQVLNGSTPSKANLSYWHPKEVAWLSSGEVNQYYIESPTDYISYKALKECSVTLLPVGTLVMGMIGQGKTRGTSAVTKIEATINQNLAAVIPNENLYSNYAHLFFQAAYKELREDARGGNQAALNCEIIRDFKITIPPINEQKAIFIEVNKISDKFDILMIKAEQAIQLMQERRTALISAAVTGKIDVRGWRAADNKAS